MGWLDDKEARRKARKKFGFRVLYLCDNCHKPIVDTPVIDPNGGYFPWGNVPKQCRGFLSRKPKVTYHWGECYLEVNPRAMKWWLKRKKEKSQDPNAKARKIVYRCIKKKKYTKEKLVLKLKKKLAPKQLNLAIRELRKDKKIRIRKGVFVLCPKKK